MVYPKYTLRNTDPEVIRRAHFDLRRRAAVVGGVTTFVGGKVVKKEPISIKTLEWAEKEAKKIARRRRPRRS